MPKKAVRLNVFFQEDEYKALVERSKKKGVSYAATIREGLAALKKQDELIRALGDGKEVFIKDTQTGELTRVIILGLG